MANFNRDNRSGGRGGFGGRRDFGGRGSFGGSRGGFGGRDRGPRQMFQVVCSNCGKDCEVPFQPTNSKPVYCDDCFAQFGRRDRPQRDDRGSRNNAPVNGDQLRELNSKLDRILELLSPRIKTEVTPSVEVEDLIKAPDEKPAAKRRAKAPKKSAEIFPPEKSPDES